MPMQPMQHGLEATVLLKNDGPISKGEAQAKGKTRAWKKCAR